MNKLQNIAIIFLLCIIAILLALNLLKQERGDGSLMNPPSDSPVLDPNKDPYIKNQVKNTILKNTEKIQKCYHQFLEEKPEKIEGQVKVDWQIGENGDVERAEIIASEFGNKRFRDCVVKKINSFYFPPVPDGTSKYIVHKFFFKNKKE